MVWYVRTQLWVTWWEAECLLLDVSVVYLSSVCSLGRNGTATFLFLLLHLIIKVSNVKKRLYRGTGTRGPEVKWPPENLPEGQTWYFDPQSFLERNIFWYTGQLILSKIIKIVATSYRILRLKCTKFDFSLGFAQTPLGELTVLPRIPDPLARNVAVIILTPQSKI